MNIMMAISIWIYATLHNWRYHTLLLPEPFFMLFSFACSLVCAKLPHEDYLDANRDQRGLSLSACILLFLQGTIQQKMYRKSHRRRCREKRMP